jgi:hypothetical protein
MLAHDFGSRDVCKRHATRCGNSRASIHRGDAEVVVPEITGPEAFRPPGPDDDADRFLPEITVAGSYDEPSPLASDLANRVESIVQEAYRESVALP